MLTEERILEAYQKSKFDDKSKVEYKITDADRAAAKVAVQHEEHVLRAAVVLSAAFNRLNNPLKK